MKLDDKVAIVTGAGRGLGRAISVALAKEGARLVLMSRTMDELDATFRETGLDRTSVLEFTGDVSKEADVKKMVDLSLKKFGTIDILVNNAGTIGPIGPTLSVNSEGWINTIWVNLVGTFLCTRSVLPVLASKGHGKIINIAGAGEGPLANFSSYASSKSAIIRFTEVLAAEVRDTGVYVNAIAPGSIKTKMTEEIFDAKETGEKERERTRKVIETGGVPLETPSAAVVFLASSESDGLTGKIISAVHDDWKSFAGKAKELSSSDAYTLRRVTPTPPDIRAKYR